MKVKEFLRWLKKPDMVERKRKRPKLRFFSAPNCEWVVLSVYVDDKGDICVDIEAEDDVDESALYF
jgi:hypothetical protein